MTVRIIRQAAPTRGDAWCREFLRSLAAAGLSAQTQRAYEADLRVFTRWYEKARGAPFSPRNLDALDLANYRQELSALKFEPSTIHRYLSTLRRVCRWARRQGLLRQDPSEELEPMKRPQSRLAPLSLKDAEVHALLRAAGMSGHGLAKRNYALLVTLLHTGVRLSELVNVTFGDIVVHDRSGQLRVRHGKGGKERMVPLNASVRRALRGYLDDRGAGLPVEAPHFEGHAERALSARGLQRLVGELSRRAKIDRLKVTVHTLRHTFATNYLRDNPGKLVELQTLLGHESLDTTAIYTRPSQEDLAADLERSHLNRYE